MFWCFLFGLKRGCCSVLQVGRSGSVEELTAGEGKPAGEDGVRKRAEATVAFGFCGTAKRLCFLLS